jgi:hypothetical protein
MTTLLDLKSRIAADLSRDDLTSQIANAVSDAIKFYARQRFWFNQSRSLTFNTATGQSDYGAANNPVIPNIVRIDALFLPQNQSVFALDRFEPVDFEVVSASFGGGRPTAFTVIDNTIRLWPTPDAIYTLRLHAHYKLPYPADAETNPWTDDAEELIRSHAKMLLYIDLLEDPDGAGRMQAKLPFLLEALNVETSARITTGVIQGTEF